MGQRVELKGVALTVHSAKPTAQLGQFLKADPGKTYLLVDVTIENTWTDKEPYNPLYFKVKDSDGHEYDTNLLAGMGDEPDLKSGELAPGDRVRGIVAFQVPEHAQHLVLSYEPLVIAGGYEPIRVLLGDV